MFFWRWVIRVRGLFNCPVEADLVENTCSITMGKQLSGLAISPESLNGLEKISHKSSNEKRIQMM